MEETEEQEFTSFDNLLEQWNQYLKQCLSPLRQTDISPMLVETKSRFLEMDMAYDVLMEELRQMPFVLPTEDEWEYLCNGGARTLFRWGDSIGK